MKKWKECLYNASHGATASQYNPVRTRVVYNSALQKTAVQGLVATGNKWPVCNWGAKSARGRINRAHRENAAYSALRVNNTNINDQSSVWRDDINTINLVVDGQENVNVDQASPTSFVETNKACDKVEHNTGGCAVECPNRGIVSNKVNDAVTSATSLVNKRNPLFVNHSGTTWATNGGQVAHENIALHESDVVREPDTGHVDKGGFKPIYDVNNCTIDDKYLNTILTKHDKFTEGDSKPKLFTQWQSQVDFDFGFVPMGDLILPVVSDSGENVDCPIHTYKMVSQSGIPNFLGCRIPVVSQLHVNKWEAELEDYWDSQLIHLIKYGFPLDFNRSCTLVSDHVNHKSALQHPHDIDTYLSEEISHKAIIGPYGVNPIQGCHVSPFMSREKSGSTNRRVIIDLSWPRDNSVNSGIDKDSYLGTEFNLTFPTIHHIVNEVKQAGRGCHVFKVDVSRAFRHVKVDPGDLDLLGLEWKGASYLDTCVPFGMRHGMQIFQRVSDAVRYMMRRRGHTVLNYVDDFLGVGASRVARHSFDALQELMPQLGLDISVKKLTPPSTIAVCLGIQINTVESTVSIPPEKLQKIVHMVTDWKARHFCSKRQLQALLGNLLYVNKCVKASRVFLNRMLQLLRANYDKNSITLTHDFKRDLRWFDQFLMQYNGVSFFDHKKAFDVVELDACLVGVGGRWQNFVYHLKLVQHYKNLSIVHFEMINILVALRIFVRLWHRKHVLIKCDNDAVVQVLQTGKTRDPFLATVARNIWFESAIADVSLSYVHIRGRDNKVADTLSRWVGSQDQIAYLFSEIKNPTWMVTNPEMLELNYEI